MPEHSDRSEHDVPIAQESQPAQPAKRSLLKGGAALAAISVLDRLFPTQKAVAETQVSPKPDPEKIKNEFIPHEELESKYNIHILDLPDQKDFIKLNFRRSEKAQPFFDKQLEDNVPLYIVPIDGPYLDTQSLSEDQRKQLPLEALYQLDLIMDKFIEDGQKYVFKNGQLVGYRNPTRDRQRYNEQVDELKELLDQGKINQDRYNVEAEALALEFLPPSRQDILKTARGVTLTPKTDNTQNKYIFVAARNVPDTELASGEEKIVIPEPDERHGQPTPSQSYPGPSRFVYNPNASIYPIAAGSTVSTDLRHEIEHSKGVAHPQTDFNVYKDISESYNAYLSGDDSGYWVVWETPEGMTVSDIKDSTASPKTI